MRYMKNIWQLDNITKYKSCGFDGKLKEFTTIHTATTNEN